MRARVYACVRMGARVRVMRAPIPPRAYVYDLYKRGAGCKGRGERGQRRDESDEEQEGDTAGLMSRKRLGGEGRGAGAAGSDAMPKLICWASAACSSKPHAQPLAFVSFATQKLFQRVIPAANLKPHPRRCGFVFWRNLTFT